MKGAAHSASALFTVDPTVDAEKDSSIMDTFDLDELHEKWCAIMSKARAADICEDFIFLRQTFVRVVGCKNKAIDLLASELSETEKKSNTYLQCMERLLEIQKSRLEALDLYWNASLKELSADYGTERAQLVKLHQQESEYQEAEIVAWQQKYAQARLDYQRACDDIIRTYAVESADDGLQQSKLGKLQGYTGAIEEQKEKALRLDCATQELKLKQSHMQELEDTFKTLLIHDRSHENKNELCAQEIQEICEEVTQKIKQLRAKLRAAQKTEKTWLVNLTMCSNNAIEKVLGIIGKGERLLLLADACRKLATEQEKVLPFYTSSSNPEELHQDEAPAKEATPEEPAQTGCRDLEKFRERYNKVRLERLGLVREKKVLEEENQQLRILVKQHLDRMRNGSTLET